MILALGLEFSVFGQEEQGSEVNEFTPLALNLSWYDAEGSEEKGGMRIEGIDDQGFFCFRTPVPLVDVARHYIDYFAQDGWAKLGDYSKHRTTNEQRDWGGIYGKGEFLISISCHGSWNIGVFTKDGKAETYSVNIIYIQVIRGEPEKAFGKPPAGKTRNEKDLEEYLQKWASEDPNSRMRFEKDEVTNWAGFLAYQAYLDQYEALTRLAGGFKKDADPSDPFSGLSPFRVHDSGLDND